LRKARPRFSQRPANDVGNSDGITITNSGRLSGRGGGRNIPATGRMPRALDRLETPATNSFFR
jgi:hypothetical protein